MRLNSLILVLPPLDKKMVSTVSEVFNVILRKGYEKIEQVPLRKYTASEHLSIYEERYANGGGLSALFSVSANPSSIREKILDSEILRKMYSVFFLNAPAPKKDFVEILGEGLFGQLVT